MTLNSAMSQIESDPYMHSFAPGYRSNHIILLQYYMVLNRLGGNTRISLLSWRDTYTPSALMGRDAAFDRCEDFDRQKAPGIHTRFVAGDGPQIVTRPDEAVQFTRHDPRRRVVEAQPSFYRSLQFHGVLIFGAGMSDWRDIDSGIAVLIRGGHNDRAGTNLTLRPSSAPTTC